MWSKIQIVLSVVLIPFILYCIYLSSLLVLKGEVHISNDIGRDFLLLQELDQKKIVFIGARANTSGVFHGPLWTYMNYPAYFIGHGSPVTIAWFWVFFGIIFLITTFFLFRKIFGTFSSLFVVALLSTTLIFQSNSIYGQIVTFYFMPLFLFTMYKYLQSKKAYFLALHVITIGIFIQFNIGVGGLFAILSLLLGSVFIVKNKLWMHFLAFLLLPFCLINFILFDMRHGFSIAKALLNLGGSSRFLIPFSSWIQNRIDYFITMGLSAVPGDAFFSWVLFLLMVSFSFLEIKDKSPLKIFLFISIFYYFGYMILTYFNKGIILFDHIFLLSALSPLWLTALTRGKYKMVFIPFMFFVLFLSFSQAQSYLFFTKQYFIGKSPDSWISLKTVAKYITDRQKGQEFGYFVYSPDSFAYQQRYAMIYAFKNAKANGLEYTKKSTTYVIVSPKPTGNPYMFQDWWIKNEARISILPIETKNFPSGYSVEEFHLSTVEQQIPYDPNTNLGLHFR